MMVLNVMQSAVNEVVPRAGVEPARPYGQRILSPQRLPFRHPGTHAKIACQLLSQQTDLPKTKFQVKCCEPAGTGSAFLT